jgi:hypothetical protein
VFSPPTLLYDHHPHSKVWYPRSFDPPRHCLTRAPSLHDISISLYCMCGVLLVNC